MGYQLVHLHLRSVGSFIAHVGSGDRQGRLGVAGGGKVMFINYGLH